ncbi:hypothetical protein [Thermus tengchongensis]|nr:hypothetical protein [Thermus tengchongensis]
MSFQDGVQLGAGFVVGAALVWLGILLILAILGALLGRDGGGN